MQSTRIVGLIEDRLDGTRDAEGMQDADGVRDKDYAEDTEGSDVGTEVDGRCADCECHIHDIPMVLGTP